MQNITTNVGSVKVRAVRFPRNAALNKTAMRLGLDPIPVIFSYMYVGQERVLNVPGAVTANVLGEAMIVHGLRTIGRSSGADSTGVEYRAQSE